MKNSREIIYDELVALSVALGAQQNPKRLEIYSNALGNHDLKAVIGSIRSFYVSARFFPQLVDIIEKLGGLDVPTDDLANQIASDIISAISRFGMYQVNEVKAHLGEKYSIVERFGGWRSLCEIDNNSLTSTRAQLRELAKSFINSSKSEIKRDFIKSINNSGKLERTNFGGLLDEKK